MKILIYTAVFAAAIVATGCSTPVVTAEQFHRDVQRVRPMTQTLWGQVYYMGSKEEWNFFRLEYPVFGKDTVRVSNAEVPVESPFPLTKEKRDWRLWSPPTVGPFKTEQKEF